MAAQAAGIEPLENKLNVLSDLLDNWKKSQDPAIKDAVLTLVNDLATTRINDNTVRVKDICRITSVSASTWHRLVRENKMPKPVQKMGKRCTVWDEHEVRMAWAKFVRENKKSLSTDGADGHRKGE